ncbi:hypothetical protein JJB46_04955 [Clostridium perfringens]|uniref:O-antigen ligase family protein n=1 Tax=Clostridium perfringens TaxID=1502 RepID=UPI001ABAABD5|nr:hypothetical protein [Clostridium perfringens]MBO3387604.1 hypothetical protein [Clostridium perfringens]MBO3413062.1 hypothetical protein [Clostridium perfringens]
MTLKNEKYNAIPIMILYLFTLVLIKVIVLDNFNYFYFVTLISGLFILYRIGIIVKMKGFLDRNRDLKYFYYIASIYVIYVLILTLVKMPSGMVYSVNIVIPFITMLFLIYDFVNSDYIIEKLNKFIFYIFLITSIAAIVMVVLGYSKIDLSFEYGIYLTPTKTYLMWDHEIRLSWLTSHKSRYALYCLIGIFFVNYNKFINKKMKVFTIVLLYINLILSSSITSIAIGGLALIFILKDIILNLFSRFRWLKILTIIGVPVIGIVSIWIVSMKRNIFTLGSRLYIWQSAMQQIAIDPMGNVSMGSDFLMSNPNLDFQFTNGHNIFINELIERGIIGSILFIVLLLSMLFIYYKNRKIEYLVANILFIAGGCIDYTIASEMTYIFWFINALWIAESMRNFKSKNILYGF